MNVIKCPKCLEEIEVNIAKAIDEHGEVFICPKCRFEFRYSPNG